MCPTSVQRFAKLTIALHDGYHAASNYAFLTLRKATRNRVQFTNDESAIKTLWLMICNIEDKRAAKRAKQGKRVAATSGRLIEGRRVTNWKQAINQMSVAYPDRFEPYL